MGGGGGVGGGGRGATGGGGGRRIFTKSAAFVNGREWRLVWTAPDGTTFRGSPTRAYK